MLHIANQTPVIKVISFITTQNAKFIIPLVICAFIMFTFWHCLYPEPSGVECSLRYLGIHQMFEGRKHLRQMVAYVFYSIFAVAIVTYSPAKYYSSVKYFQKVKQYLKHKLKSSSSNKLFDQLVFAIAQGIIKPQIYPSQ